MAFISVDLPRLNRPTTKRLNRSSAKRVKRSRHSDCRESSFVSTACADRMMSAIPNFSCSYSLRFMLADSP